MVKEGVLRKRVKDWLEGLEINANDLEIFIQSLTHRSYARQFDINSRGNEQLEFLGDSILSFVITSYLYKNYGYFSEGKLAKIRSILIDKKTLVKIATGEIKINSYILLSENEELSKGRYKESILADSLEAFIGALYIDKGIDFTSKWILKIYKQKIDDKIESDKISDYKTHLQELVQADYLKLIKYKVEKSKGPAHNKVFYSIAIMDNKVIGKGEGKSKKQSEQEAARNALGTLYNLKL
ncbi:MAG: ribonuclease III [Actinobacteria bacterium]|nr:ribonuclease III [Actinomycetota bacterium]